MKYLLITLIFLISSLNIQSQNDFEETIWQVKGIYDSINNPVKGTAYIFVYFEDEKNISILEMKEKLNWDNGEQTVHSTIEIHPYLVEENGEIKIEGVKEKIFFLNSDSIIYDRGKYKFGLKKLALENCTHIRNDVKKALIDKEIIQATDNDGEDLISVYRKEGMIETRQIDRESGWSSHYMIISFQDFVFIKGITSPPYCVENLNEEYLTVVELDYRYEPKRVKWEIEK